MPRKAGVNKSAAVRELLGQNMKMPIKELVGTLAEKGIKVAPSMVYYIKSMMKKAKRKQLRQRATRVTGNGNAVDLIRKTKELARDAGGMANLRQLVEILAE